VVSVMNLLYSCSSLGDAVVASFGIALLSNRRSFPPRSAGGIHWVESAIPAVCDSRLRGDKLRGNDYCRESLALRLNSTKGWRKTCSRKYRLRETAVHENRVVPC
jgi:hypothetical protein